LVRRVLTEQAMQVMMMARTAKMAMLAIPARVSL
jgi:hypothetical protein